MKEQIESAMRRQAGDSKFSQQLTEHFNAQNDLFTTCQRCKQQIKGTINDLQIHGLLCDGKDN